MLLEQHLRRLLEEPTKRAAALTGLLLMHHHHAHLCVVAPLSHELWHGCASARGEPATSKLPVLQMAHAFHECEYKMSYRSFDVNIAVREDVLSEVDQKGD